MVDNRSLKARIAANRAERKAKRYAEGGQVEEASPLLPPENLPQGYQDPKTQALQTPLVSPEDLVGMGVAKVAGGAIRAAAPAIAQGAGALMGDEVGSLGVRRSLEPLQALQQHVGFPVTPAGEVMPINQATAFLKAVEQASTEGRLGPGGVDAVARARQHLDRAVRRGYADGGEVGSEPYGTGAGPGTMDQAVLAQQNQQQSQLVDPADKMAPNPGYFDPKDEALQTPAVTPEDLAGGFLGSAAAKGVTAAGRAAAPYVAEAGAAVAKQGGRLLADEAGEAVLKRAPQTASEMELEHYSNVPNLKEIDPAFMGNGFDRSTKGRNYSAPVSFHYLKGAEPETETGLHTAKYKYSSKVDASKIYNLSEDAEGIAKKAIEENNGVINMDDIVSRVKDEGYHGFTVPAHPHQPSANAVMLFHKVPVTPADSISEVPMYSRLEQTVQNKFRQKMTSADALTTLKNSGVTNEEMDVYGVKDFLQGRKSVTPEELQAHLEENRPQIQKHVYGEEPKKPGAPDDGRYSPDNLHPDYDLTARQIREDWHDNGDKDSFYEDLSDKAYEAMSEDQENPSNKFQIEQVEDPETGETKHVVDFGNKEYRTGYGANRRKLAGEMHFDSEDDAQKAIDDARDSWEESAREYHKNDLYHSVAEPHIQAHGQRMREEAHQRYLDDFHGGEEPPAEAPALNSNMAAEPVRGLPDDPLAGESKYDTYRLQGGSNYREELYTGPSKTEINRTRDYGALQEALEAKAGGDVNAPAIGTRDDLDSPQLDSFVQSLRKSSKPEDKAVVQAYDKVVPFWKQTARATIRDLKAKEDAAEVAMGEARNRYAPKLRELGVQLDKVRDAASRAADEELDRVVGPINEKLNALKEKLYAAPSGSSEESAIRKKMGALGEQKNTAWAKIAEKRDAMMAKAREPYDALRDEMNTELGRHQDMLSALSKERENLISSIEEKSGAYKAGHFGSRQQNVFAHGRTTDRVTEGGKRALHIEEVQSDAHQEARDLGYLGQPPKAFDGPVFSQPEMDAHLNGMQGQLSDYMAKNGITDRATAISQMQAQGAFSMQDVNKLQAIQKYKAHLENPEGVPEMIMAKSWDRYGFKRLIKRAIDQDKDVLTWNTGEISARNNGTPPEKLKGQILNYDLKYPGIVKKLVNEFDPSIKVEKMTVDGHQVWGIKLTDKLKKGLRKKGFSNFAVGGMVGAAAGASAPQKYAEGGVIGETPTPAPGDAPPPGLDEFLQGAPAPGNPLSALIPEPTQDAPPPGLDEFIAPEMDQLKYGTGEQQFKAGLEGLGQGLAGPISTGAEMVAGVKPEDMRGRERANPWTHGIAEGAGFLGGAMLGTGEAGLLAKAGEGAALVSGFAHEIPAVGEAAAKIVARPGMINQIGTEAVKGAFEAALFQGGEELTKTFRADPDQTAQMAITDIGLAAVMGGTLGAGVGGILGKLAPGVEAPSLAAAEIGGSGAIVSQIDRPAFEAGDLSASIRHSDTLKPDQRASWLASILKRKEKANAPEIKAAAKVLGDAPLLEGIILDDKNVQKAEDYLIKGAPTYSGMKRQALYDEAYGKVVGAVEQSLGDASQRSKAELGDLLKTSISSQVKEQNAPIAAMYDELKASHDIIPINTRDNDLVPRLVQDLEGLREMRLSAKSPEGQLLKRVTEELPALKTVDDLKWYKSSITGSIQGKQVSSNERRIVGILSDKLTELEESSIEAFAKKQMNTPEAYERIMGLIDQRKAANGQYKTFISKVGALSEQLGKGKIYGVQDALRFINELTPETVVQRLATTKDSEFRSFFAKNFPEQSKLMNEYMKGMIRQGATKDGTLSPRDVLTSVFGNGKRAGMEPEIQKSLFSPEELKKLNAARVYYENFPKNFNPSGTSHGEAFRAFMTSPKGSMFGNARDLALEAFIKGGKFSPHVANATTLGKATVQGDKLMDKALKSFFAPAQSALPAGIIPLLAHRDKLNKLIQTVSNDPSKLMTIGNNTSIPEYSKAFAETSTRAVQYLSKLRPNLDPNAPLDSRRKASPAEENAYNRALDIAQQPLVVLDRMKKGTLTPSDVTAIKTIYPNLYQALAQRVMTQVIDARTKGHPIPYANRLQLSLFLGQPLDSTMTPQSILQAQAKGSATPAAGASPQPSQGAPKGNPSKLSGMPKASMTPDQARQQRMQRER